MLVDTIKAARDKFGRAGDVDGERFISNKRGERMPAAALNRVALADSDGSRFVDVLGGLGIKEASRFYEDGVADFVELHTHCVESTVAEGVSVTTFAELWRKSGELGSAMMDYMACRGILRRWYDSTSERVLEIDDRNQEQFLRDEGSYFDRADTVHGLLPPVEAMFAIEVVNAAAEGREITYDHLYVMSTEYTKEQQINEQIADIALGTLALLGIANSNVTYRYVIADNQRLDQIGGTKDHFTMMKEGNRFNVTAALGEWEAANA